MVILIIWQAAIFVFSFPFSLRRNFISFFSRPETDREFVFFDSIAISVWWGFFLISRRSSSTEKTRVLSEHEATTTMDVRRSNWIFHNSCYLLFVKLIETKKAKDSVIHDIFNLFLSRIIFISCVLGSWMDRMIIEHHSCFARGSLRNVSPPKKKQLRRTCRAYFSEQLEQHPPSAAWFDPHEKTVTEFPTDDVP